MKYVEWEKIMLAEDGEFVHVPNEKKFLMYQNYLIEERKRKDFIRTLDMNKITTPKTK